MTKVIDDTNLGYLISKIKATFWPKTDVVQIDIDNTPTVNSNNLVKSGGVYTALSNYYDKISGISLTTNTYPQADVSYERNSLLYTTTVNPDSVRITGYGELNGLVGDGSTTTEYLNGTIRFNGLGNSTSELYIPNNTYGTIATLNDIPSAVTESTVSGWGFTKNTGTLTGVKFNGTDASITNGVAAITADIPIEVIEIIGDPNSITSVPAGTFARCGELVDENKSIILRFKWDYPNSNDVVDYILNTINTSGNSYSEFWFSDGSGYSSVGIFSDNHLEIFYNTHLYSVTFNGTAATVTNGVVTISETDPVFSASPAAGITASDITNWNGKTSNTGTITGITMNGASKGTSGVVDLGTVLTSHQDISGKANDSAVVHNTGAETIAGLKTFSNGISTPSDIATRSLTINGQEPDALSVQSWSTIYNSLEQESLDDHITDMIGTLTSGKATDTAVVHLAGTETITGDKTFDGSVYLPDPSSIYFTDTQEGLDEIINSIPNITISSSEPTSSQGSNGDIWIVI